MQRSILVLVIALLFGNPVLATTLSVGDIAIIGFNADGGDDFSFVTFKDLDPLTSINFTDNEWNGVAITSGEGFVGWTAPVAGVTAGTVVVIDNPSSGISANVGTAVNTSGSYNLAAGGDQILAYQGPAAAPTFLFAIQTDSTMWGVGGSEVPAGLADGSTALAIGSDGLGADEDNGEYIGTRTGTQAALLAEIADLNSVTGNWTTSDGTGDQSIVLDATAFTVLGGGGGGTPVVIAGTSFEEPADGGSSSDADTSDHELSNVDGSTVMHTSVGGELGFRSFFANSNGNDGVSGDFIGVTNFTGDVGAFDDGVQGYEIVDPDGDLTVVLDTVSLAGFDTAEVSVAVFVVDTRYETNDAMRIFAVVDGGVEIDLINLNEAGLDTAGGAGVLTIFTDIVGASEYDYDNANVGKGSAARGRTVTRNGKWLR